MRPPAANRAVVGTVDVAADLVEAARVGQEGLFDRRVVRTAVCEAGGRIRGAGHGLVVAGYECGGGVDGEQQEKEEGEREGQGWRVVVSS